MNESAATTKAVIDGYLLFLYALAAVTGGAAGCALAAVFKLRGVRITPYIVLAYISVAGFAGLLFTAFYIVHGWITPDISDVIIYGGASAAIVGAVLSGVNVTIRFTSRKFVNDMIDRFGVGVEIDADDKAPKDKSED